MITKQDLYKLGYEVKTELEMSKRKSTDFRVADVESSPYLVNLSEEGCVRVDFPLNAKNKSTFSTCDLEKFVEWQNNQI